MLIKFRKNLFVMCSIVALAAAANAAEKSKDSTDGSSEKTGKSSATDGVTSTVLEAQVMLDRLLFSPGAIDGLKGRNADLALKAFQKSLKLNVTGEMDDKTSEALRNAAKVSDFLQSYIISQEDVDAKFLESIPEDKAEVAKLEALSYANIQELLAERFHTTPEMLAHLNPNAEWETGQEISVPNVFPTSIRNGKSEKKSEKDSEKKKNDDKPKSEDDSKDEETSDTIERRASGLAEKPEGPLTIIVTKQDTSLNVLDKDGNIVFHAPVSAGSEHDPLPLGDWKVNGTERYPKFNYNPELFWDAEDTDKKAKLPAGPNNPVGVAWIDITKPHYGLHGTPNPEKIGYTESHGCVRLTNWDVLRLADLVKPGTEVKFLENHE